MKKYIWVIVLFLAIVFILPPIIILRSFMYGTNGTGIACLTVIYACMIAGISYSFFDDYLKRFNINWIHAFTGIIFGLIPFVAITFGLFLAGVLLNDKYVNKERHRALQTEVVDEVNNNREKFFTIDSLISAHRKVDPALSANQVTKMEALYRSGESELNKEIMRTISRLRTTV